MVDVGNGGRIVNNASIFGMGGSSTFIGAPHYAVTKAAMINMTQCAALDYIPENIRVNAVAPTVIETPMLTKFLAEQDDQAATMAEFNKCNPMGIHHGTIAQMSDVTGVVSFLVGPDAKYINGQTIAICGGYTIQ